MHLCFPVGGWPSCSSYILGGHVSHRRAPATDVVGVRRFWSQSLNPVRTQHSACKRLLQGAGRGPSRMDGRRGHTREPHPHKPYQRAVASAGHPTRNPYRHVAGKCTFILREVDPFGNSTAHPGRRAWAPEGICGISSSCCRL